MEPWRSAAKGCERFKKRFDDHHQRDLAVIVFLVALLHGVWGVALLAHGGTLHFTAETAFIRLVSDHHTRAALYLLASLLASLWFYGHYHSVSRWALLLLVPQQFLLLLSALAAILAVWHGAYGDGVVRSRLFILADQIPYPLLAVLHATKGAWSPWPAWTR